MILIVDSLRDGTQELFFDLELPLFLTINKLLWSTKDLSLVFAAVDNLEVKMFSKYFGMKKLEYKDIF